jgi:DNA-binding transcriptional ArsR family regulator
LKISKKTAKVAAQFLKKIGHPDRLLTSCHLTEFPLSAGELANHSELRLSAFSQHLAILRKAKLVEVTREAQTLYYSIKDPSVLALLSTLKTIFCPEKS